MLCSVRFCSVLLAVVYVYKWKVFCSRCSKWKGGILYNLISVLFHLTLFEQFCSINRCIRISFYLCQNHKQINKNKSNKFLLCDAHARQTNAFLCLTHSALLRIQNFTVFSFIFPFLNRCLKCEATTNGKKNAVELYSISCNYCYKCHNVTLKM